MIGLDRNPQFEFRLRDDHDVTAQCTWQFDDDSSDDDPDDDGDDPDDDSGGSTPTVRLSALPNPVDEGNPVTVTAWLSDELEDVVKVPLTLTAGTAEPGDYGTLSGITIAAGQTRGTGTVSTTDDADRDDETFRVALGSLPSSVVAGSPNSVTVTIRDTTSANEPPAFEHSSYRFELRRTRTAAAVR
ncbi:MAG: hypothetical protein OXG04_22955 [Acidobacteria bacterium]|nr:hypothetical protein [Acidobacteriota bacterium]